VSACSSSSSDTKGTGSGGGTTATSAADVSKYLGPITSYAAPGPPVDATSLRGKKVFYVPINYSVPLFHAEEGALAQALSKVGMTVVPCDGAANPSTIAQCLSTAADQGASAVVLSDILPTLVPDAISELTQKHIPVVVSYAPSSVPPSTKEVSYVIGTPQTNIIAQGRIVADWIAGNAKGNAKVMMIDIKASQSYHQELTQGLEPEMKKKCPKCQVFDDSVTTTDINAASALVSSTLIADPDINYIVATDSNLLGISQGLQQAGDTGKVKIVFTTGQLAGLQALKAGTVAADLGEDTYYQGWADADQVVRVTLGKDPVQAYPLSIRLFTKDNIGELTLSQQASLSNSWYGPTNFESLFTKNWGVGG
jgi:ribose transport system substrate-binding protein